MEHELNITFRGYRIVRAGEQPADGRGRYDAVRPDGSSCCQGVMWSDVEDAVLADQRAAGTDGEG